MPHARILRPTYPLCLRLVEAERSNGLPPRSLRVVYQGLWLVADVRGIFPWTLALKQAVAPWDDDFDIAQVLDALAAEGFIYRWEIGRRVFGWIPTLAEHSVPDRRERQSGDPAVPAALVEAYLVERPGYEWPPLSHPLRSGFLPAASLRRAESGELPPVLPHTKSHSPVVPGESPGIPRVSPGIPGKTPGTKIAGGGSGSTYKNGSHNDKTNGSRGVPYIPGISPGIPPEAGAGAGADIREEQIGSVEGPARTRGALADTDVRDFWLSDAANRLTARIGCSWFQAKDALGYLVGSCGLSQEALDARILSTPVAPSPAFRWKEEAFGALQGRNGTATSGTPKVLRSDQADRVRNYRSLKGREAQLSERDRAVLADLESWISTVCIDPATVPDA